MSIFYKTGYKYQLTETEIVDTGFFWGLTETVQTPFLTLEPSGQLTILRGYAWDGPSGPTIDTKDFLRGSLVHDALYQLMRQGHIEQRFRDRADQLLWQICLEDGMWRWRAYYVYKSLHWFGGAAADQDNAKQVHTAP